MNKPISQTLRTLTVLVLAISASLGLRAQTGVEYFFDSDPGLGQAQQVAATANADGNLQFSAPTDGLTPGSHLLGFRAYRWVAASEEAEATIHYGPTLVQQIYVPRPASEMAIRRVEYFWDSDPGYGLATQVAITPGLELSPDNIQIPTDGLTSGTHTLGIRAFGDAGWGPTLLQEVYVPQQAGSMAISRVEYFWDSDPGAGQGTPISVTPGQEVTLENVAVSTDGLTAGAHRLFLRAFGDAGWGPVVSSEVYVPAGTGMTISRGEYFWNDDPGFGQGTPITFTPGGELTIDNLQVPSHAVHGNATLFVRFQGTKGWSPTYAYTVMVDAEGNYTLNAQTETSMEGRNFQSLNDMADDFTDRGIGGDVTMNVTTKNTDYTLDLTDADRLAQAAKMAQNLEQCSAARDHVTIGFTAAEGSGNTLTVTAHAADLPTVVSLLAQTSQENVVLTINGTSYDFTEASKRSQTVCSEEPTAAVALSTVSTAVKATWTAQPHEGTTLSGYKTEGTGDLPEMTLANSGTKTDSLAYNVTLSTSEGQPLYSYTYYYYVRSEMANQTFTTMLPATGSTVDPVKTMLQWNTFNEATGYRITVTEAAEGGDPETIADNVMTTEPKYELTVKTGYTYTWKVTAVGNCDELTSGEQTLKGRLLPDFVVENITLPEAAPSGSELTVMATVKNQGQGPSVEGRWTDRLYYTINSTKFDDAVQTADVVHEGNVAADGSYEVTFTMTVPFADSGTLRVFVEANADQAVMETNATAGNNRLMSTTTATMTPLYIQADDLAALRALYGDFGGNQWSGTKWNAASELVASGNWSGVTFNSDGRVTAINLQGRGLTGTMTSATPLSLPLLTTLNLSRNALTGDPAHFITSSVPLLKTLDLGYNQIDELSKPLSNDITLTLTYQHRTYGKTTTMRGMENLTSQTLNIGTLLEAAVPDAVGYVHKNQNFDAIPDIYIYSQGMTRYGTLSWSNTNDCYGFSSYGSNMKSCVQDENVYLVPATGAFANSAYPAKVHLVFGDANMTGWVDVNDVQSTLNYIISNTTTKFCIWSANTWNSDALINIQDIVCTVNIVLDNQSGASSNASRRSVQEKVDNIFFTNGRNVWVDAADEIAAFDLELEGVDATQVRLLLNRNDWQMLTRDTERGVRLVVFSPTGQTLTAGQTQLLRLSGDGQPVAAQATSPGAEAVAVGIGSSATGIGELRTAGDETPIYDLQGRRQSKSRLSKGVYIQNGKKIKK